MSDWQELTKAVGDGWNRFWFTPRDPRSTALLRILVGLAALYYVLSYSSDLLRWFGPDGLLPVATVVRLNTDPQSNLQTLAGRWSYLDFVQAPSELWTVHWAGVAVLALFTCGALTRITSVLSVVVVLSYVHRAPMLTGQFEPVLTLLLIYLCLAPCGASLSVDAWLKRRRSADKSAAVEAAPSVMANVSIRLIQVHIAALYLLMALTKLGGTFGAEYDPTWWRGEALWWLIAKSDSRIVDLTGLHGTTATYLVNLWTHATVAIELAFALLIWNRLARPILLGLTTVSWLLIALVTGWVGFALIMLVAGTAFASPRRIAAWTGGVAA